MSDRKPWPLLLMTRSLGHGGTERQVAEIAKSLDRDLFTPQVGCFDPGGFRFAMPFSFKVRARGARLLTARRRQALKDNKTMTGIQFVTDDKGRRVAVLIDLKKYGDKLEDFWDGLISESRRKEKGISLEKVKADLIKRGRLRE